MLGENTRKKLNKKYGFGTFQNIDFFRLFKYGGRAGKGIVKFCQPHQVANFSMLLVQNSLCYVNIMTFESILGAFFVQDRHVSKN